MLWVNRLLYRNPFRQIPLYIDTLVLMRSQYWPREKIDSLVDLRLRDIVRRVRHVPLWQRRFAEAGITPSAFSRIDLLKIPPLTKQEFFSNDSAWYTDPILTKKSHVDHTSGSTGQPLRFFLDWRAELRYFAIRERMFLSVTGNKRTPVIYFRARINPGFFFGRHKLFFLQGYNKIQHRLNELVEFATSLKKEFALYGYTSSMTELARRVREASISLPIRAIVATGEGVREADRAYIEENLCTKFHLTYATWEVKWIGHECEFRRCHINEEYVYIEIADEEGNPLPVGQEGRILVTSFDSEAMPFIRYALGDRGIISEKPCPCGRTLRTIQVFGRQSDIIAMPDGRVVPLFDISTAFDTHAQAVRQYQITQTGGYTFRIRIVPGPQYEKMRDSLHLKLVNILHPKASVVWEVVVDIPQAPSGKAAYFVRDFT